MERSSAGDANQLAADGTSAGLVSSFENGKYLAYGTSPSGSEMSTLHIIETKTALRCPTRLSARALAALHGCWTTGILLHAISKRGDVREGQEMYNRHVFYHDLGTDPETDTKVFGEGRRSGGLAGRKPGQ